MCACVMRTASSARGSKGGSFQLRSRSSFKPWNIPQSTSTRALSVSTRYFEPVTVPTPPQNEMAANLLLRQLKSSLRHIRTLAEFQLSSRIAKINNNDGNKQRQVAQGCLYS